MRTVIGVALTTVLFPLLPITGHNMDKSLVESLRQRKKKQTGFYNVPFQDVTWFTGRTTPDHKFH
jgi:hypothetical protein